MIVFPARRQGKSHAMREYARRFGKTNKVLAEISREPLRLIERKARTDAHGFVVRGLAFYVRAANGGNVPPLAAQPVGGIVKHSSQ